MEGSEVDMLGEIDRFRDRVVEAVKQEGLSEDERFDLYSALLFGDK
jgi:hypothetical protein